VKQRRKPTGLTVEEADVRCAGTFRGVLICELHALSFAQQLEHGSADGRTVEEFHATFVAYEPETFVDQQTCNRAAGHDCSFDEELALREKLLV
jgi:hypothetical protein